MYVVKVRYHILLIDTEYLESLHELPLGTSFSLQLSKGEFEMHIPSVAYTYCISLLLLLE